MFFLDVHFVHFVHKVEYTIFIIWIRFAGVELLEQKKEGFRIGCPLFDLCNIIPDFTHCDKVL